MYYRGRKSLTLEQNDVAPTERKRERLDERERERERRQNAVEISIRASVWLSCGVHERKTLACDGDSKYV